MRSSPGRTSTHCQNVTTLLTRIGDAHLTLACTRDHLARRHLSIDPCGFSLRTVGGIIISHSHVVPALALLLLPSSRSGRPASGEEPG